MDIYTGWQHRSDSALQGIKAFTLVGVRAPRVEPMMTLYCRAAQAVETAIQTGGDLRIERGAARCLVRWCWRIVLSGVH